MIVHVGTHTRALSFVRAGDGRKRAASPHLNPLLSIAGVGAPPHCWCWVVLLCVAGVVLRYSRGADSRGTPPSIHRFTVALYTFSAFLVRLRLSASGAFTHMAWTLEFSGFLDIPKLETLRSCGSTISRFIQISTTGSWFMVCRCCSGGCRGLYDVDCVQSFHAGPAGGLLQVVAFQWWYVIGE